MSRNFWIACCSIFFISILCLCGLVLISAGGSVYYRVHQPTRTHRPTPVVIRPATQTLLAQPTSTNPPQTFKPTPSLALRPRVLTATPILTSYPSQEPPLPPTPTLLQPAVTTETLLTLQTAIISENDLLALATQLEGKTDLSATVEPSPPYQIGDRQSFWISNDDTNEPFQVETVLRSITDHTYFWIEEGVRFDSDELSRLAETFENEIYPTNQAFFGSEWTPGVDGDPRLYILYVRNVGYSLAGYFSSVDEYPPSAHEFSNAHETFILNADNMDLGDENTYGTLAHEFQHMIQWNRDRNEDTWMNEGFSMLAEFLNGYPAYFDYAYIANPDIQLSNWLENAGDNGPHYGASFLFLTYFLDRFGENVTRRLVSEPENGLASIDRVLAEEGITDPLSGNPLGADDIFRDWTIANYIKDGNVADGRFTYQIYPESPQASETESIYTCPTDLQTRDVSQYGVDYIRFTCPGDFTLHFEGSIQTQVVPAEPHSGAYYFWSNAGDESDMTLTREFDFTTHSGALTLSYWTWYDLEEDYDYVYVEASSNGQNWQILSTPSCTTADPSGNSYGCGYNGYSNGWIQESVDLTPFAGQKVLLRFQYITDAALNGAGLLLDDIAIPEIDYATGFEADDGGWQSAGFVRIQNVLPQTFRLALITHGETTSVEYISLNLDTSANIPLSIHPGDEATLVVAATTRYTRQKAAYRFEVLP